MDTVAPSDTFFTLSPGWGWLITFYFFFGGIAAGSFVVAAMLDLFGRPEDRRLANLGYLVALPALILCPPLLIIDLTRPERFWHMLLQNHTLAPMLKTYSPMSLGSWAIAIFGIFVTIGFLGAMAERSPDGALGKLAFLRRGAIAKINAVLGGIFGFFVAGYTGVLLSVTNRPVWADTNLLGAVFLLSSATTSAALLVWLGSRGRAEPSSLHWLDRFEVRVAIVEIVAIVALVVTLGPVARVWMNVWGVLLALVVLFGLIVPIVLHFRARGFNPRTTALASALALAGGLLLRAVVILSSEAV